MNDEVLRSLSAQLTLEEKVLLLTGQDSWSTHPLPRIGLRSMVLSDGPAGVRGDTWDERSPSINFPSPTAISASWDRRCVRAVGEGLGQEAVRKGVDVVLGPTINIQRTPYGGRHFEAFSEDAFLTSEIATAYVRGVQAHGVGATVKHYVANDSETDRFTVDVRVDERALREVYLRAFEGPVVDGGAWLVMSAYNSVNGRRATESPLLRSPLGDEWGFDGVVVSDWTAVRSIESARYPQDLVMPGPAGPWGDALVAAVRAGEVDEAVIDEKVMRMLRLAARTGALENVPRAGEAPAPRDARETARRAAVEGSVLLRNVERTLPLVAPTSIAVIGEGAARARTQGGGSATVIPASVVSPWGGLRARWPEARMTWSLGAVVERGLTELAEGSFRTPAGEPGMEVAYLAADGHALSTEVRRTSTIVSFDAASLALRCAVVEFRLEYTPPSADGDTFAFGIAGLCDYEVLVDGEIALSGALRTAPGDDPAAAVLHPPSTFLDLPRTGESVPLTVRLRPVEGGIPDALSLGLGVPPRQDDPDELIAAAALAASEAETAVVVVSTSAEVESEGFDRTTLRLPGRQDDLVRAVVAANPRTVVVVNSGSPVLLPWADSVAAILAVWFPGQEAGGALADVLSGDAEPGGRLPVTWPSGEGSIPVTAVQPVDGRLEYREGIHVGYRAWLRAGRRPAFAFGSGEGYTRWALSFDSVPSGNIREDGLVVTARAENLGECGGKIVAQLYAERISPSEHERPARWLVAFESARADGGESTSLALHVPPRALAVWTDEGWLVEPGDYRLVLATSSEDVVDQVDITVSSHVTVGA